MVIYTIFHIVTGILKLIGSLTCKEAKALCACYLISVNSKMVLFSVSCCWYMLELPHRGNPNMYQQHIFDGLEILHYKLFFHKLLNYLCFFN